MPILQLTHRDGSPLALSDDTLEAFTGRLRGPLIAPDDADYEAARRVYNGMHDGRRPGMIVQAVDAADVMAAVGFARAHHMALAVRGGGHNVAGFGTCDGGLVLDLGRMKGIRVDTGKGTVRAEGGVTWGDMDHATQAFGLAVPGGVVSTTGIAGLTLGGGMGHLTRRGGLSCDNLISADVVLADGRFVTCDDSTEPDLFWALRGGGGNFGVVTAFEYRTQAVSEVFGGPTFYRPDPAVLRRWEALLAEAGETLQTLLAFTVAPPLPFVPPDWHGKPVMATVACWSGPEFEDARIKAGLDGLGEVVGQAVWRMPYPTINTLFDTTLPKGLQHYWKAHVAAEVTDAALAAHIEHGGRTPCRESGCFLFPIDGACHRLAPDATAFPHRSARYSVIYSGSWPEPTDNAANIAWVRNYAAALAPHSDAGGYGNFMNDDDENAVAANYGQNLPRLKAVKTRYDPENLFRLNQNIAPG